MLSGSTLRIDSKTSGARVEGPVTLLSLPSRQFLVLHPSVCTGHLCFSKSVRMQGLHICDPPECYGPKQAKRASWKIDSTLRLARSQISACRGRVKYCLAAPHMMAGKVITVKDAMYVKNNVFLGLVGVRPSGRPLAYHLCSMLQDALL